jgi:predicted transcriptional regulator
MAAKLTTLRMPEDIKEKLGALAKQQDRSVGYLINTAVKRMIDDHEAMLDAVNEGLAQLDAGQGIPHDEVMRRGRAIIDRAIAQKAI